MALDLEELERLAAKATPGPWKEGRHDMFSIVEGVHAKYIYANSIPVAISTGEEKDCERVLADARYIAAACNAVPELIARVQELERQKRVLVEKMAIDILCSECPVSEACPYENATFIELEDCAKQLEKWSENAAKEAGE